MRYNGASREEMVRWAVAHAEEHRDSIGEIRLTDLEGDTQMNFEVPDREWEDLDMSYEIWWALERKGMLE